MTAMQALPKDSPIMIAWENYKSSDEYANSRKWAASEKYVDGSMWAAFLAGYQASAPSQPAPVVAPSMTDLMVTPESIDLHLLREACDWPQDLTFKFLDEPGEHDPCYVIMPGGAMLAFAHHDKNGVDQARAQFIVDACNEKIASNG